MRSVPFFNYPALFTSQEAEFQRIFANVAAEGPSSSTGTSRSSKSAWRHSWASHMLLESATRLTAWRWALLAAGVKDGDEVILSSHTNVGYCVAVHFAGAKPVPVECGPDHLIDPAAVEAALTPRTRAIMPTQLKRPHLRHWMLLGGSPTRHGLLIVEDRRPGFGIAFPRDAARAVSGASAAISFYPAKVLGCHGRWRSSRHRMIPAYMNTRSQLCNFGRDFAGRGGSMGVQLAVG